MTAPAVQLSTLAREGLLSVWRLRALRALLAAALALSLVTLLAPLPLRNPGHFSLSSFALLDQLLVTLLVAAHVLAARLPFPPGWWPCPPGVALAARGLGIALALAVTLGAVVLLQYLGAWAAGDVEARLPLHPEPRGLGPDYALMGLAVALYGLVLTAWAQTLRVIVDAGTAVLALMALVFSAYLLPRIAVESPALEPIAALLPHLGTLAPLESLDPSAASIGSRAVYAVAHAGAVWALGAVLTTIRHQKEGAGVESDAGGA